MPDFLPTRDADLVTWANNFGTKITATPTVFSLTALQATTFAGLNTAFVAAFNTSQDPMTRSPSNIITKNQAKRNLIANARLLAGIVQRAATTTNLMRSELGITVPVMPSPVPPPSEAPNIDIVSRNGTGVKIKLHDGTGSKRGKPGGVSGASVFSYVGATPPIEVTGWHFEGNTTRTLIDIVFANTLAPGTVVWLTAFWYNPRAQSGPGCTPVSAILAGGGMSQAA